MPDTGSSARALDGVTAFLKQGNHHTALVARVVPNDDDHDAILDRPARTALALEFAGKFAQRVLVQWHACDRRHGFAVAVLGARPLTSRRTRTTPSPAAGDNALRHTQSAMGSRQLGQMRPESVE